MTQPCIPDNISVLVLLNFFCFQVTPKVQSEPSKLVCISLKVSFSYKTM